MREFLAIVITFSLGLFVTTVLAYSLERRQLDGNPVDLDADVQPGILAVSASGYASKFPATNVAMNPERAENSTVQVR